MDPDDSNSLAAFGFLTVLEDPQHGFFGGYLVLSSLGRPLEFHCSTPVLPSPAQQILYGATLRPYVLGEIIGPKLLDKAQLSVQAVVTDLKEMLSLVLVRSATVACLQPCEESADLDIPETSVPELAIAGYRLFGTSTCTWQPEQLRQAIAPLCKHVDLAEPFERIREAIREAQRIAEHPSGNDHEPSVAA